MQNFEVPTVVFLPLTMVLSQADIDYQLAHAGDFNCSGLNTFTITLMIIVSTAVGLRLLARKIAKIDWKSDDYTLIAGWVRSCSAPLCRPTKSSRREAHGLTLPLTI